MGFNVDLSKLFPERAYTYLTAFLPGLFFEISILLGNPAFISQLAARGGENLRLTGYALLGIALLLAFVIGNAFMILASFIRYLLTYVYSASRFVGKQLCRWPLKPLLEWLMRKRHFARPGVIKLHQAVVETAYDFVPNELHETWRCWHRIARRLLQVGYGIAPENVTTGEWSILYWTLGRLTLEDQRGSLVMIASHAIGWSGLAATRIAPRLQHRYYVAFCFFLIFNGLAHDWFMAKRRMNPIAVAYTQIQALLREIRDTQKKSGPSPKTPD